MIEHFIDFIKDSFDGNPLFGSIIVYVILSIIVFIVLVTGFIPW